MLISAVVDNMGLSNREELLAQLKQASQPNPQAQQMEQQHMQMQMEQMQAQLQLLQSQAQKYAAEAQKATVEAQLEPQVVQAKLAAALATNLDKGNADEVAFAQRAKMAELLLKERDIVSNERIAQMQVAAKRAWQSIKNVI